MSIKGIDSQIMITRTSDIMRENAAAQKKPEVTQEYLAVQAKANEAHDQKRVSRKSEIELPKLRAEDGGGNGAEAYGDTGSGKKEKEEILQNENLVPPGNNVIDIKV